MSTLSVTFNDKGDCVIGDLPPGVFTSRFPSPPDNQIRDVISINARNLYAIEVLAPAGGLSNATAELPLVLLESSPDRILYSVDVTQLPAYQSYGFAGFELDGAPRSLGVIVNPASLLIPVAVDLTGEIGVIQDHVPYGVHFNPKQHWFTVWGAGGYNFAFSLPSQKKKYFSGVTFNSDPGPVTFEISSDGLTVWMRNNYLHESREVQAISFDLWLADKEGAAGVIPVDPTIINNPINQGGSDGGTYEEEPGRELVAAGAFAA